MLAVPFLVGVAASDVDPWQAVLAAAAVAGYLASATAQVWARSRGRESPLPPIVYGSAVAVLGLGLVVAHPALLATLPVLLPAAAVTQLAARPGTRRGLAATLAQVAQALVLVPAAAIVAGPVDAPTIARATAVAGTYLVGSVLVVRSVLRDRDRPRVTALSIAYHLVVAVAAATLGLAYVIVGAALALRATVLPIVRRRRAGTGRPLRPVHVGLVELATSILVVGVVVRVPL